MLPSTTTTNRNSKISFVNLRRFTRMTPNTTAERCSFVLIHLFFSMIIFIIVYVRLEQFNNKQEKLFVLLKSNHNLTIHQELQSRLLNQNYNVDCSCQSFPYPKRNRTTRCLELHIGSTEIISNVFCPISRNDQEHHQWLTIQNRQINNIKFNRTWNEYRRGFGSIFNQTDFWIGNENLYWLTNHYQCRLKIELTDWHNETRIALYESFSISDHNDDYRLRLSNYSGNMEKFNKIDTFSRWHHNAAFSTYDHHYGGDNISCPDLHGGGGWWYHSGAECAHVQLNGLLATQPDGLVPHNTGVLWTGWKADRHYSFQRVRMLIQAKLKRDRLRHRR